MLIITADLFSGRPNPQWLIEDSPELRATLGLLSSERNVIFSETPSEAGLGFRGFKIELLDDHLAYQFDLNSSFYIPLEHLSKHWRSNEFAERLIALMRQGKRYEAQDFEKKEDEEALLKYLIEQLSLASTGSFQDHLPEEQKAEKILEPLSHVCWIELWPFNPGFWNNDQNTLRNNNCYNYASNWRTNTFAQPGRGSGHMYSAVTCPAVSSGALSDGMHHRYDCFPDNEKPRFLVAMVVAPGPGFVDYHWYRKHKEGFWGHKPGGTQARNVDNSGNVIFDPQTCNRGPYTQFCGYFYGCNSQRHRIR
ncbi:MAG: hypothetical protein ACXV7J_02045 [Methylomonas sp.]